STRKHTRETWPPQFPPSVPSTELRLNGSGAGAASVPATTFLGKKVVTASRFAQNNKKSNGSFKVVAVKEDKQTDGDRWRGLAYDMSDDQQDITRGKGMVDSVFQAPMGTGTHNAVLSSYEYISQGLKQYNLDNMMDGLYIAPAFMDKLVVHITKNFLTLPNIKVPLILGVWGGKGQGKSFQCELVMAKMGINPIMMSAGELESGNAGEPAKLIRQRYREAADLIKKGKMCCLFINDLDAGAGRMGGTTQYTVNNQMVNATLMNIADNPTNVQLPGMYNKEDNARVPIIVTGNDFSTLYAPLIRDGRMEKFYWAPTREDRIGVCKGIFRTDKIKDEDIVTLVDQFPGQSIDFFGALRARVYDDEVRKFVEGLGVEKISKRLVNSREGPPVFEQPEMTLEKLMEYGNMLVMEQENVKRVQLADQYLNEAALGDANADAIGRGTFFDFFGALRARVYDDEVRKFVEGLGVEKISKRLVNSREGPPVFEQPEMTLEKLMEYGNMLVMEQENVKRVQLANQYLNEAALGDANADAIGRGTFFGQTTGQA
ncbi:hypothetical protein HID58_016299, partial [Brassica napus]